MWVVGLLYIRSDKRASTRRVSAVVDPFAQQRGPDKGQESPPKERRAARRVGQDEVQSAAFLVAGDEAAARYQRENANDDGQQGETIHAQVSLRDRDQRQVQVSYLDEQTVQGRPVGDGARDDRSVLHSSHRQSDRQTMSPYARPTSAPKKRFTEKGCPESRCWARNIAATAQTMA